MKDYSQEKLLERLGKQLEYYRTMLRISWRERSLIERNSELREILPLFAEKRRLAQQIDELRSDVLPLLADWGRNGNSPAKEEVEQIIKEISEVLEQLIQLEEENQRLLNAHYLKLAEKLKMLNKQKAAHKAYKNRGKQTPRFVDKEY